MLISYGLPHRKLKYGFLNIVIPLMIVLSVVGCSNLDFGRSPFERVSDAVDSGEPDLKDHSKVEQAKRHAQLVQTLEAWRARQGAVNDDYVIGAGDELRIEVLSLESLGETAVFNRSVTRDGKIVLPWAGEIQVSGYSPAKFEKAIADVYRGRVLKNPQVSVRVVDYRSSAVVVTGAVNAPGVYYLKRRSVSVLEVLSMCGGLSSAAGDELLILRDQQGGEVTSAPMDAIPEAVPLKREGAEYDEQDIISSEQKVINELSRLGEKGDAPAPLLSAEGLNPPAIVEDPEAANTIISSDAITVVDLNRLIEGGDMRLNLSVSHGDVLSIPAEIKEYIYVLGYVRAPGARAYDSIQGVTALNALALAGGLTSQGRAEKSYVMRELPTGGRRVIPVNLAKIARGIRPDVDLIAGDTLVVGSTFFLKLSEFIRPTVGAGMNYSPVP